MYVLQQIGSRVILPITEQIDKPCDCISKWRNGVTLPPSTRYFCHCFDVRLLANDLAFSCERTKMNSDHAKMVGAFVCCNGVLGSRGVQTEDMGNTLDRRHG
jgi:hypothetical protein